MHSALLLGDSLFARFEGMAEPHINVALKNLLPLVQIDNKAVSGDNSFDLLKILQKQTLTPSDWVFVFIGANDLAQHKQVFLGEPQSDCQATQRNLSQPRHLSYLSPTS